jgi:hypothetical protein
MSLAAVCTTLPVQYVFGPPSGLPSKKNVPTIGWPRKRSGVGVPDGGGWCATVSPAVMLCFDTAEAGACEESIGTALSIRSAVQYFSSSLRLGPSEGEGEAVGSADCVEDAEGVAESVGSTAPATVDGAEGAGDFGGT